MGEGLYVRRRRVHDDLAFPRSVVCRRADMSNLIDRLLENNQLIPVIAIVGGLIVGGIWIIFGAFALTGVALVAVGRDSGFGWGLVGALLLALSLVMIAKTTRNY